MPAALWTLTAVALVALAVAMVAIAYMAGRAPHARCPTCRYDLRGHLATSTEPPWNCPECGRSITTTQQTRVRRPSKVVLTAVLVPLIASWFAWCAPSIARDGWRGAVPLWAFVVVWPLEPLEIIDDSRQSDETGKLIWTALNDPRRAEGWLDAQWADRVAQAIASLCNSQNPHLNVVARVYDMRSLLPTLKGRRAMKAALSNDEARFPRVAVCGNSPEVMEPPLHTRTWAQRTLNELGGVIASSLFNESWIGNGGDDGAPFAIGSHLIMVGPPSLVARVDRFIDAYRSAALAEPGTRVIIQDVAGEIEIENVTDLRGIGELYTRRAAKGRNYYLTTADSSTIVRMMAQDRIGRIDPATVPGILRQIHVDAECSILVTQGDPPVHEHIHALLTKLRTNP